MTCAHTVSVGFRRIAGVESADIGLERGRGVVKLALGNNARVEEFWKVVWGNGNKPRTTRIVANGVIEKRGDRLWFKIPETGQSYRLDGTALTGVSRTGPARLEGELDPPKDKKSAVPIRAIQVH